MSISTDYALEDGVEVGNSAHLVSAERWLTWTRRAAFAGWGVILYAQGYPIGLNAAWMVYAAGVIYMAVLHWHVRKRNVSRTTSWVATFCDSVITFFMCLVSGGAASPFLPFFYFTTLAGAFRFGVGEIFHILLLNGASIVALHILRGPTGVGPALLSMFYLGFAAALGAMLANWAHANLKVALARSAALRIERDRSNSLLRKLIGTQEEERKRIAEDLHDHMGARLFHLQHSLDQCSRGTPEESSLSGHFKAMRREINDCNSVVRSLMNELRPNVLDDFGFLEALSEYVTNLVGVISFAVEIQIDPALHGWRSKQDAMLFRLIQEALLNVRKHAHAAKVVISLNRRDDKIALTIEDDGRGFDPASVPVGHFGVLMMRERAKAAGGCLHIDSAPGTGARIFVTFG